MGLNMPEDGYLYVYVSNESQKDVNFDNLQIGHSSTHLTEINDYYPYGLLISNNSSFGSAAQNYKYNGKELQTDLSFNVEDYGARYYDPVIGRWMQVDPLAEKYRRFSPYNYVVDNPIRFIDPDGMRIVPVGYNQEQSTNTLLKATYNQFGQSVGYQMEMALGGQGSKKEFKKSLKTLENKSEKQMAKKLFNVAIDVNKTIFLDVIKPTTVTMNSDGITIDRFATGRAIQEVPNTNKPYPTGYENSTIPTPFDASPIDASKITPGNEGSYSVTEPDKSRGLVITTSKTKELTGEQEKEMLNSIIHTNDDLVHKK